MGNNDNVTFTVKVTMKKKWVNIFCSMLKWMESCGKIGHSSIVGFYSDGDGDFRPEFEINTEFEEVKGITTKDEVLPDIEVLYDAG